MKIRIEMELDPKKYGEMLAVEAGGALDTLASSFWNCRNSDQVLELSGNAVVDDRGRKIGEIKVEC